MSPRGQSGSPFADYERMAEALLTAAPTALYVFDLVELFPVFVSPRGLEMLGLDATAVAGLGSDFLLQRMHPEDVPRVMVHFAGFASAADGETRVFEYRMHAPDGTWRWFRSHDVVFTREPNGTPRQVLGLGLDVTAHKAAEQALQESEASFRRLADALPQFVWVTGPDGVLTYVNERWTAFSGLDLDQTNEPAVVSALYHPDDRDRVAAAWAESFASGVPLEIEARMRGQDGAYRWFLIRGVSVTSGTGSRWFGTSTDITTSKEDATQLERLQAATAALSAAASPAEVHRVAMATVIDLGARAGALYEVHGDELVLVAESGFAAPLVEQYRRFPLSAPLPLSEAVHRVSPVWIRSRQDYVDQYPHLAEQIGLLETEAAVGMPLVVDDRVVGALSFTFGEPLAFGIGEQRFLLTLASLTAQAMERATLYGEARATNERFALAEHAARAFSFAWEPGTNRVERSAGLSAVLGYESGEVAPTQEAWNDLVHPDDRKVAHDQVLTWLENAETGSHGVEYRVRHKDGSYRWLSRSGTTIRDAAGQVVRVVGHAVDVTERKIAEEALRASEERYRDLVGRIDQGFCVFEMLYGPDGRAHDYRFLEINPTFARHTGLANAVGKTARELVPGLEDLWVQRYAQVAETGVPQRFEQGSDAMGRWFEVEAVRVGNEESRKVALLFADVTERKRAAALLEQRQREFESLAEHLPDIVARFDRNLRYTYVNAAAIAAIGLRREDFLGRTNADLGFPPDLVQLWEGKSRTAFATGVEQRFTFTFAGPHGPRSYDARVVPEGDASGAIETVLAVVTDVSDRLREEAERVAFLDALAHDVKNPLGAAKGRAQLARRQLGRGVIDPGKLESSLAGIDAAVNAATGLIDDLLDVAHLRAGRSLQLRLAPVELGTLVQACADEATQSSGLHSVRVSPAGMALIGHWDAERLRRVLRNLLDNAVKYSPEGGEILMRVGRTEDEVGNWAEVSVTDQGMGIPEADQARVFERFHRGANVAGIAGTGIGLSGAKHIVEQHGGTIVVMSVEGEGSTFTVKLPL